CREIGQETGVSSPLSDVFKVEMLGGSGGLTTSNVRPSIEFQTTAAFNGSYVVIYCQNTPMGYADTEIYTINGVNTSASGVTLDSTNAGKEVTCTLTSPSSGVTFSSPTSAVAKLPILV
ncbi:GPI-anchored protein PB15E9.01c, partial [Biomphalaria glabrata]